MFGNEKNKEDMSEAERFATDDWGWGIEEDASEKLFEELSKYKDED